MHAVVRMCAVTAPACSVVVALGLPTPCGQPSSLAVLSDGMTSGDKGTSGMYYSKDIEFQRLFF